MEFLHINELAVFEFGFVYYGFSFYERSVFVFQSIVYFSRQLVWLRTTVYHNHFFIVVLSQSGHRFLGVHGSNDLAPT